MMVQCVGPFKNLSGRAFKATMTNMYDSDQLNPILARDSSKIAPEASTMENHDLYRNF